MTTLLSRSLLLASIGATFYIAGCAGHDAPSSATEGASPQPEPAVGPDVQLAEPTAPFAEIADDHGGAVLFFDEGDDIGIGVRVKYPNRPMVPSQFIEHHGAEEVFLAVAPAGQSLPVEMANRLRPEERERVNNPEVRAKLQTELGAARAAFEAASMIVPPTDSLDPPCSASFKSWVNDVYGGSECGLANVAVHSDSLSTTYCPSGCDADIYFFGSAGDCQASLNQCSNTVFTGTATNVNARRLAQNGDYSFNHLGFRSHFGAANCDATVAPTTFNFKLKYGTNAWIIQPVAVGEMYYHYDGRPMADQGAGFYGISYANYKDSAAEVTRQMAIEGNSSAGDAGIFCADVLTDYNATAPSCGGCNWCTSASPCNGCFSNCAGN